ncbi:hypothetical protein KM176_11290 [Pseudooceanicola sp. CBS1P-1]|uniref:Uncharacterized protein n=1 Tax=Pseudooceanicola albus TaxID=2692189 RepID=A0A6L7G9B0_9RHOB|nr:MULTISPECIES: hypothetical protein [Pseudooceanicola]MBT9384444.1 hypothetical protein [Pseudooceanicola endophyticus]MXN20655.1 hypothetical protein [Pseudooceanicola albus]
MSNRLALVLGSGNAAFLVWDHLAREGTTTLFLLRKGVDFITWIAFWH